MNKGMLSVDEALERVLAGARPVAETETVPTLSAAGRVLAAAQRSAMNVPPLDNRFWQEWDKKQQGAALSAK